MEKINDEKWLEEHIGNGISTDKDIPEITYPTLVGNMVYPPVLNPGDEVGDDALTLAGNIAIDIDDLESPGIEIEPVDGMDGRLAGDVVIDLPTKETIRGVVLEPGLAGYIVLPYAGKRKNKLPIKQRTVEGQAPLMGSIAAPRDFGTLIEYISLFLEKYKIIKRREAEDKRKLIDFILETKGQFHWNKEYLEDEHVTSAEKMDCAKDIAVDNLRVIKEATKTYQRELQETDDKGMKI